MAARQSPKLVPFVRITWGRTPPDAVGGRQDGRAAWLRLASFTVATTLLDGELYPAADIAALYRARRHAELDLRSLKITLAMDVLRGKSPEIVRKDICAHLLAYNLIRSLMAQTAVEHSALPRSLSFKVAVQTLHAFATHLGTSSSSAVHRLYPPMLAAIAAHRVGDRPDRFEPHARKRRPKPYLTVPRREAKPP